MTIIEVESIWHSITKSAGYVLLGASLGMYYGCSRESAICEQKYEKKLTSAYKEIKKLIPASKQDNLEKILLEER